MQEVQHISIAINRSPAEVYAFASDPRNLPSWAAGLARSEVRQEGDAWIAEAPFGKVRVKFAPENTFGVLDHDVTLESGVTVHNPMRVVANGEGSEFVFTLLRRPEMTDAQFTQDRAAVEQDLKTLKALLEPKPAIVFKDGAAYDRYMGAWSRLAGEAFLEWLKPKAGLRWLDVGCGNGAFTELIARRCAPSTLEGIDPSEAQLESARAHPALKAAVFRKGDAMALPFAADAFDVAVMPLVVFFLTDPAKGVAEMARVVAPGGLVTAYAWDMPGGGFPYAVLQEEMKAMGRPASKTPSPEVSKLEALQALWTGAGLEAVATRIYAVERTFSGFEEYWSVVLGGPSVAPTLAALSPEETADLQARLKARLPAPASGGMVLSARVHAIQGRVQSA